MGKKKQEELAKQKIEEEIRRIKLPRGNETMGIVEQRVGGSRMRVRCFDGVTRICRVPGRLRTRLWIREGDVVVVKPWEFSKEKGDIIFKYRRTQVGWLRKHGYLDKLMNINEF